MSSEDELARELDLACGDLLTAEANESILVKLFTEVPAGEWLRVGLPSGLADVHLTWLHLPSEADEGFRFVIFLHAESAWSMTATCNVQRLLRSAVARPCGRAQS